MDKGCISKIESFGLMDGPGIRTVVFFSGCKLRCKYCQNHDTLDIHSGTLYTPNEILDKILKYKNYFIIIFNFIECFPKIWY